MIHIQMLYYNTWCITGAPKITAMLIVLILFVAVEPNCLGACKAIECLKSLGVYTVCKHSWLPVGQETLKCSGSGVCFALSLKPHLYSFKPGYLQDHWKTLIIETKLSKWKEDEALRFHRSGFKAQCHFLPS